MNENIKIKIHEMIDTITNESLLQMVSEDINYYTQASDIMDELDDDQVKELDNAISEAENDETISWKDFKKEMEEWKQR